MVHNVCYNFNLKGYVLTIVKYIYLVFWVMSKRSTILNITLFLSTGDNEVQRGFTTY
jgi:hypothetical protein